MPEWFEFSRQDITKHRILIGLVALPLVIWWIMADGSHSHLNLPKQVEFNRDIRPILSDKCFACHGPDAGALEADLRLDVRSIATSKREGYDRPAIVPGRPGKSELVRRITSDDPEVMMPPKANKVGAGGKILTEREKALLTEWIDQGAEYQKHWAYIPPARPEVPEVEREEYVVNPIDNFIVARLDEMGQQPSDEADRQTLIRRLSLDLRGLPPEPEEVDAFASDAGPEAYEERVDRMLASPHYGERMAVWWLDLVRYAETDGYHSDLHRHIYPFRDYVIQSFNENKPFDQFTREQIAGDLLPRPTREQLVASGFNRLNQATKEGGSQPKEYLVDYAIDRVRTVSNAWMASSVECAQCHDHKYDPFTQEDFFSMAAFFADIKERGLFPNLNLLPPEKPLPSASQRDSLEIVRAKVAQLEKEERRRLVRDRPVPVGLQDRLEAARNEQAALSERMQKTLVTQSVEPRLMRVLARGDWRNDDGPIVQPGVPEFLPDLKVEGNADRLDLADWLVSRENPLTARAIVNQLWDEFFGTGLSRNLDDFGGQGEWPTHPELLDWLAVEFVDSGWDVQHIVKLIVTSRTYRQASRATDEQLEFDPQNRYLARQARFRLKAELIRDNALAVSGLLNEEIGGPSVKPYQPEGYWSDIQTFGVDGPAATWVSAEGEDQYRRGLYTYWKRSFLHPSMEVFNAPSRQQCTADRVTSNTPLQALVLLNDPTYVEAARVFADRVMQQGGQSFDERVAWAYERALTRPPMKEEVQALERLFEKQIERYRQDQDAAQKLLSTGQYPVPEDEDVTQLAAWTSVTRSIFNLHETITRY